MRKRWSSLFIFFILLASNHFNALETEIEQCEGCGYGGTAIINNKL
jgi:hypothetical protein